MKPPSSLARFSTVFFRQLIGFLVLLMVCGCGLAMSPEDRLDRAEQAFNDGDIRAAIIEAKDVLLDEPNNLRGRLLLGRASVAAGDGAAAEKELKKAIQLGAKKRDIALELAQAFLMQQKFAEVIEQVPLDSAATAGTETSLRSAHGDAYLGLGQSQAAREMYTSVLERQPHDLAAQLGIASTYIAEQNFGQARGTIEHALETNPEMPRAWLYSGAFNTRVRNFETAEANFRVGLDLATARNNRSARLEALAGLSNSLFELGKTDAVREYVDKLAAEAPEWLETKLLLARVAIVDQDWLTAQQNLQQVHAQAPEYRPAQVLLGSVHMESGNLAQAEMYLSAAVAAQPEDVIARQLLAATQLQLRKADEAQEALAPIIERADADSVSLQMAARASMGRRDVDEALEYLLRSIDEDPGNVDVQFQLAATLLVAGRTEEAQKVLDGVDISGSSENAYRHDVLGVLKTIREGRAAEAEQAARRLVDEHSGRFGAFNLLGGIQLANGDIESARAGFERANVLEPSDAISQRYLAGIDESQGNLAAAEMRYRQILSERPAAAWAMFALGRIAFSQEDFEAAAAHFKTAIEAEPDNADFRLGLAKAERQLGNRSTAAGTLENDFEASLEHIPSAVMLGALKAEEGDIAGALDIAKQLQNRHPGEAAPLAFEGEIHLIAGDLSKADMAYDKALEFGLERNHVLRSYHIKSRLGVLGAEQPLLRFLEQRPLDNAMRIVLAESYTRSQDLSKSIANYERVVSEEPMHAVALNNLAWNYYLVNDPRAVDTARKALDAMPHNGAIVDTLGWILVQRGEVEEGEQLLRQAVELEKGRAEIRYHHAVALSKLGRNEEARATLQNILASEDIFASRQEAEQLLAKL